MGDAYEPYHVHQESRRDKLRIPSLDTHFHLDHPPPSSSYTGGFHPNSINHISNPTYTHFMGSLGGSSSTAGDILVFKPEPLSLSLSSHPRLAYHLGVASSGLCRSAGDAPAAVTIASRSSGPLGPFTGYASILKGSRFLKPAHMVLDEFCNVGRKIIDDEDSTMLFDSTVEHLCDAKKSILISMLDEVYRRYKQYYEQLQAVMGSFECVAGLGNAAPYASLALKALSKHFKCVKNVISDQLQFNNNNKMQQQQEQCGHVLNSHENKNEYLRYGGSDSSRGLCSAGQRHYPEQHSPVWRPHRGLPEQAVTILRAWLFDHFLHPYPTDTDKIMLAKQTGLSRNQVSNWFINARVRVWKPMVEEIHTLETRQSQRSSSSSWRHERSTTIANNNSCSSATQRDSSPARRHGTKNSNIDSFINGGGGGVSFSYGIVSSNVPAMSSNTNGGVSLTLGLHHQIGLPEPFQMTTAQRFGLDGGGGYEGQNRQFGSNHQFLHDFVG